MASNNNPSDLLVALLAQQKDLHELENQNLPQQDREALWQERVQNLTSALLGGRSPTNQTMPSPPTKSALAPSPMARAHSIAVVEPTQMNELSPNPPEHVSMSRKRSAPGATPSTPTDCSPSNSLKSSTDASGHVDDYTTGAAPKLQRTASGRLPRGQLRIQRPQFARALEHQTGPMSAASSTLASPFTPSPNTPYDCTPPNSALSTASFGPFSRAQQLVPYHMDRNDSLGGPFYRQMTQMNLSSSFDQRHSAAMPHQHHRPAHYQQFPEIYELDPASMAPKYASAATSPPIAIPQHPSHRFIRRTSNPGPGPRYLPAAAPPQYFLDENKVSPSRMLAPRPSPENLASRSISSSPLATPTCQQHARPIKVEGVEKYQIPRLERCRVEKQKLFCNQCNKQPDGFRGAHELQRHKDAQHSRVRKVWVCIDGSRDGNMLSGCKNCRAMKTYPAYYNAAAHLRRMHFKPKPEVAQKGKVSRAGSGGGDDPPIDTLKKFWMKQVLEVDGRIIDPTEAQSESVEEDVSSEEEDCKEEDFDAVHELDNEAIDAADQAIPHLSSTIDTISSYVDITPEESNDFPGFDYDCTSSTLVDDAVSTTATAGRSLHQNLCNSVLSAGSSLLDTAASFAGDLDFSELFPVSEFFPPA